MAPAIRATLTRLVRVGGVASLTVFRTITPWLARLEVAIGSALSSSRAEYRSLSTCVRPRHIEVASRRKLGKATEPGAQLVAVVVAKDYQRHLSG